MTDAETLASAASAVLGLSPLIVKLMLALTEPEAGVMDEPARIEALEASRRTLALSEECASRVTEIERALGDTDERALEIENGGSLDAGRFSFTTSTGD